MKCCGISVFAAQFASQREGPGFRAFSVWRLHLSPPCLHRFPPGAPDSHTMKTCKLG